MISSITPNSLKGWPDKSILVVANDAGATSLLLGWLKDLDKELTFCMQGPAEEILKRERPQSINSYVFLDLKLPWQTS